MAKRNIRQIYLDGSLTLDERFVKSEIPAKLWIEELMNLGHKPASLQRKIRFLKLTGGKKLNLFNQRCVDLIDAFTMIDYYNSRDVEFAKHNLQTVNPLIRIGQRGRAKISIIGEKKTITIQTLSEKFPEIGDAVQILTDTERAQHCHRGCLKISEFLDGDAKIVTGTIFVLHPKQETLHTWIETQVDGEECVIDHNFNAILRKNDYYQLFNANPIQSLSVARVRQDKKLIDKMEGIDPLYLKLYLISRNEFLGIACVECLIKPKERKTESEGGEECEGGEEWEK
ncbi:MAG: hypothetical protein IJW24_03050 [Clostridia bacterium]|nr:hypothetical protein [Clostridia bacterium]